MIANRWKKGAGKLWDSKKGVHPRIPIPGKEGDAKNPNQQGKIG